MAAEIANLVSLSTWGGGGGFQGGGGLRLRESHDKEQDKSQGMGASEGSQ